MPTRTKDRTGNGAGTLETREIGQIGGFNIAREEPWTASFTIRGSASLIFHRWVNDDGDGPSPRHKAKTDDVEGYVWRNEAGDICLPGEYVRQSLIGASKWRKDPRSSRASAVGLFKASIVSQTELAPVYSSGGRARKPAREWDYLDSRRAVIQRSAITRVRPCFSPGWEASFEMSVLLPEYVTPQLMYDVLVDAGRLVGVGDFRPSYGRYGVARFEIA
jgi:hypothetical protein